MIRTAKPKREIVINLDGPDGNAFSLLAYAKRFAEDMGYASDEVIINNNLVKTFDHYFGNYVVLETTDEDLLNA